MSDWLPGPTTYPLCCFWCTRRDSSTSGVFWLQPILYIGQEYCSIGSFDRQSIQSSSSYVLGRIWENSLVHHLLIGGDLLCIEQLVAGRFPAQFVFRLGAGVHEGLSDDGQRRVHHLRHVHVKDEVRVLQDVHPEPQRQAGGGDNNYYQLSIYYSVNTSVTPNNSFICDWMSCLVSPRYY